MMEAAVKYLHFNDSGAKPALCLRGNKFASCVVNDECAIHVQKIPLREYDQMRPVPGIAGQPYEPKRCANFFLDLLKRTDVKHEVTLGAKTLIDRVASGDIPAEELEFIDEPIVLPAPKAKTANGEDSAPRSSVLGDICAELKIEPTVARRALRKAGLGAPYTDGAAIRKVLIKE